MNRIVTAIALVIVGMLAANVAFSAEPVVRLDPRQALARSEQAVGRTLGVYTLTDSTGAAFSLTAYRG